MFPFVLFIYIINDYWMTLESACSLSLSLLLWWFWKQSIKISSGLVLSIRTGLCNRNISPCTNQCTWKSWALWICWCIQSVTIALYSTAFIIVLRLWLHIMYLWCYLSFPYVTSNTYLQFAFLKLIYLCSSIYSDINESYYSSNIQILKQFPVPSFV